MRELIFGPKAGRTALLVAAMLSAPFLFAGLFADDYYHQLLIQQAPGAPGSPWGQFTFATGDWAYAKPLVENGPFAWWWLPELKFIFVRPLAAGSAILDHALFGRQFIFHHLHSLLWYLGLVAVVRALFRRSLRGATAVAGLAAVLFALDDAHALVAGWIANRNALMATAPALLGVLAHVRWREDGFKAGLPLSMLGITLGLASGESALGAVAYLLAYELTASPGSWRTRARSVAPLALLGVGYVALYKALNAGAYGSGIYVDPLREPLRFLGQAPTKALALLGAQYLGSTADVWLAMPRLRPAVVGTGVVAVVFMVVLLRRLWPSLSEDERRATRWLGLGSLLSLVPVLATFPLNRLLLMPSVGGSLLLALVLFHGWRHAEARLLRVGARVLFVTTVVVGVLGWLLTFGALRVMADLLPRLATETELSDDALARRVYVFMAPDPVTAMYVPMARTFFGKPPPKAWLTFCFARSPHRLTRVDAKTFELELVGGRMMETVFEQLQRAAEFPLELGYRRQLSGALVEVIGLDAGLPNRLRITFDADPDGGQDTFAQWKDTKLVPLVVPRVGETLEFPKLESAIEP